MKKSLLMTTALVALVSASNARAEDWTVSAPESIENQILNKDPWKVWLRCRNIVKNLLKIRCYP